MRFRCKIRVVEVPARGAGRKVSKTSSEKWHRHVGDEDDDQFDGARDEFMQGGFRRDSKRA